ncbi:MAG: zinc ABC transporter substrate-binding protein [Gluconacetobacter diazotrophicus]|nr:zinc ABC transporter substrate-binding protein [Gluconacetobacter diazotrophicus]
MRNTGGANRQPGDRRRSAPVPALLAAPLAIVLAAPAASAAASPPSVVAAENFYGDVARQLAGPYASVSSVLSNPDEDPHLFEASPSVVARVAAARLVILNGLDYDPWMGKLLAAAPSTGRSEVVAAAVTGARAGSNPHLWYAPATMPAVAAAVADQLSRIDPAHAAAFAANLSRFRASLAPIDAEVARLRARWAGTPVTATEPVFGLMAAAIGLDMRNGRFQLAVMNDTEPAASDIAAMETDLRNGRVRLLIYNSQASDSAAQRLLGIARASGIPVLGVTETEPRDAGSYQSWILGQLQALDRALAAAVPGAPAPATPPHPA